MPGDEAGGAGGSSQSGTPPRSSVQDLLAKFGGDVKKKQPASEPSPPPPNRANSLMLLAGGEGTSAKSDASPSWTNAKATLRKSVPSPEPDSQPSAAAAPPASPADTSSSSDLSRRGNPPEKAPSELRAPSPAGRGPSGETQSVSGAGSLAARMEAFQQSAAGGAVVLSPSVTVKGAALRSFGQPPAPPSGSKPKQPAASGGEAGAPAQQSGELIDRLSVAVAEAEARVAAAAKGAAAAAEAATAAAAQAAEAQAAAAAASKLLAEATAELQALTAASSASASASAIAATPAAAASPPAPGRASPAEPPRAPSAASAAPPSPSAEASFAVPGPPGQAHSFSAEDRLLPSALGFASTAADSSATPPPPPPRGGNAEPEHPEVGDASPDAASDGGSPPVATGGRRASLERDRPSTAAEHRRAAAGGGGNNHAVSTSPRDLQAFTAAFGGDAGPAAQRAAAGGGGGGAWARGGRRALAAARLVGASAPGFREATGCPDLGVAVWALREFCETYEEELCGGAPHHLMTRFFRAEWALRRALGVYGTLLHFDVFASHRLRRFWFPSPAGAGPPVTTAQVCFGLIKPATAAAQCSYAELLRSQAASAAAANAAGSLAAEPSEAELEADAEVVAALGSSDPSPPRREHGRRRRQPVGRATLFVSHAWENNFLDLIDAVEAHVQATASSAATGATGGGGGGGKHPAEQFVWCVHSTFAPAHSLGQPLTDERVLFLPFAPWRHASTAGANVSNETPAQKRKLTRA